MTEQQSNSSIPAGQIPYRSASSASYPLTRCPRCRRAFREEITDPARPRTDLALVTCHYCGLHFQRFSFVPAPA